VSTGAISNSSITVGLATKSDVFNAAML